MKKTIQKKAERVRSFVKTGLVLPAAKKMIGVKTRLPKRPELGAEIKPDFIDLEQHVCFGCSPRNTKGLKLKFYAAHGWDLGCRWNTGEGLENYPGMIHGGIITTVLDELVGQAIFAKTRKMPVSLNAQITWLKAVKTNTDTIAVSRITAQHDGFYAAEAFLFRGDGRVAAFIKGLYMTPTLRVFRQIAELDTLPDFANDWFVRD